MRKIPYILIVFGFVVAMFNACRPDEEFTNDPSANLSFSTDTIFFDTLFTQLASGEVKPISVTKILYVKNNSSKAIRTNIRIQGNFASSYRLNIDGEPTNQKYAKEILGKDSIIILIQCYIDPGTQDSAFLANAQLMFETNGNIQDVDLVGYGQNAKYLRNKALDCSSGNLTWTSEKPYVIYDSILVPEGCTLTINAGTKIHSYNRSCILVAGTLIVNGTVENPVIFEGTRLDAGGKELSNQWAGIRFLPRSKDNVIKHAIIRNGFVGVEVDSLPVNANPNLRIEQTKIYNMQAVGIVGYTSNIVAVNNEISNCGQFGFFGALGGNYKLYHNTIVSYNTNFNRQNPLVVFDNSPYKDGDVILAVFPLSFELVNNIIEGSLEEEFLMNNATGGGTITPPVIQTNFIRTKQGNLNVNGNKLNMNIQFENTGKADYRLGKESPAKNAATNIGITADLLDKPRSATPSVGCYE